MSNIYQHSICITSVIGDIACTIYIIGLTSCVVAGGVDAALAQRPRVAQDLRGILLPPDEQDPSEHDGEAPCAHQHDLHLVRGLLPLPLV